MFDHSEETQRIITDLRAQLANRCDDCGSKLSSYPNGCPTCGAPECCQSCCKINHLRAELDERWEFLAATSLCKGCQQKREERAIIATPRIQVEEERDTLRAQLATANSKCVDAAEMNGDLREAIKLSMQVERGPSDLILRTAIGEGEVVKSE